MCKIDSEYENAIRYYLDWIFYKEKAPENTEDTGVNIIKPFINYIKNKHKGNYLFKTPVYGWWDVTSACNLRCAHCLYKQTDYSSKNDLTTEQALSLADELINIGVVQISLTGGEIFTRPDILQIIRKFKENNVAVKLLTNGILLNDEIIDELSEILNYYVDNIHISLDAACGNTFAKIRQSDCFHLLTGNIKKLTDKNIRVINVCTVNKLNYKEVFDIYKLSCDLGASDFVTGRTFSYNGAQDDLLLSDREIVLLTKYLLENEKSDSKTKLIPGFYTMNEFLNVKGVKDIISEEKYQNKIKLFKEAMSCNCHSYDRFRIKSNGDISLCMETDNIAKAQLGNFKKNSFLQIWDKRSENICFGLRKIEKMPCFKCRYNVICNGGCQIKAYARHGNINYPQQDCVFGN